MALLYDAFISYNHAKDKPIAAALQSAVQKLGKPWYRRRALRVFRDDTSLSATPQLWPSIEQALGQSRYFILLASPQAAASNWVNKEVQYWLDHNSIETLLIGVTEGELSWDETADDFATRENSPLPPVLAGRFPVEPKWVDLRAYRDGADKAGAKFTELAADFAAAIRGMPKEDLLSQEVRQQRRALTLAWGTAAALFVLTAVAAWQWNTAADRDGQPRHNGIAPNKPKAPRKNRKGLLNPSAIRRSSRNRVFWRTYRGNFENRATAPPACCLQSRHCPTRPWAPAVPSCDGRAPIVTAGQVVGRAASAIPRKRRPATSSAQASIATRSTETGAAAAPPSSVMNSRLAGTPYSIMYAKRGP